MFRKDTGRSWVVLFASSTMMFIETGIVKSFGVLLPDIREQFSTKTWVIGFVISLTPGFGSTVCLLSGAVNKVLEPRRTIILFASLVSVGLFATAFATNLYIISITLLLTGFNTGTTSVSGGVLSQYFDRYCDIAVTGHASGMSLGMAIMPIVTQYFLDIFGWRGTVLLLSGISANAVVCGALFKSNAYLEYEPVPLTGEQDFNRENAETSTNYLKAYLDVNLFSNFQFIACMFLWSGNGFFTTAWLIYVVPHVIEAGFTPYEASLVATLGGFANFVGNVSYPLTDIVLSRKTQLYLAILIIATSFAVDVIASSCISYVGLVMCAVVFGISRGIMATAVYPVLNEAVDEDKMINAIGWMYAMYGVASILSGFTCGWLYDRTGSYNLSFLVMSAVCLGTLIPQCVLDMNVNLK